MIGKGSAIPEFIERITEVVPGVRPSATARSCWPACGVDHPDATAIDGVDYPYYEELVRKEQYDVDAQVVRTYFDFSRVRAGLLDVTARLFDLTYTPVDDAVVWHPDVTAYDVSLAGETLGPHLPRPAPARGQVLARGAVHDHRRHRPAPSCPRACSCATSPRG